MADIHPLSFCPTMHRQQKTVKNSRSTTSLRTDDPMGIQLLPRKPSHRQAPFTYPSGFGNRVIITAGELRPDLDEQLDRLELERLSVDHTDSYAADPYAGASHSDSERVPLCNKTGKVKAALGSALEEAKHFAGGLISHPYETTKHYSVLRHSLGVVYFNGPSTSVTITIFADRPLPADRQLWLQRRGYAGRPGLQAGTAIGTRGAWINVTPAWVATPDQLHESDERAWQRDINKHMEKARHRKHVRYHVPCETNIVRIPFACEDGDFRIVVCDGRRVLCPSPVFRCASASFASSTLRGARLRSLPLELSIKAGAVIAQKAANKNSHSLKPSATVRKALTESQSGGALGAESCPASHAASAITLHSTRTLDSIITDYQQSGVLDQRSQCEERRGGVLIGTDVGPQSPYPINMSGIVTPRPKPKNATKSNDAEFKCRRASRSDHPTATLSDVSTDTVAHLQGIYFAWAKIKKRKKQKTNLFDESTYRMWHKAVLTISPPPNDSFKKGPVVSIHLLHDFQGVKFHDHKLVIMLLGFIRSLDRSSEDEIARMPIDISIAKMSLSRPAWSVSAIKERTAAEVAARMWEEHMTAAEAAGQRRVDAAAAQWLGVKGDELTRGKYHTISEIGGICVKR